MFNTRSHRYPEIKQHPSIALYFVITDKHKHGIKQESWTQSWPQIMIVLIMKITNIADISIYVSPCEDTNARYTLVLLQRWDCCTPQMPALQTNRAFKCHFSISPQLSDSRNRKQSVVLWLTLQLSTLNSASVYCKHTWYYHLKTAFTYHSVSYS